MNVRGSMWILGCGILLSCGAPMQDEEAEPLATRREGLSQVFTQQVDFTAATGATLLPFPVNAFDAYPDHPSGAASSCVRTPPGVDLPWGASAPTVNVLAPRASTNNWLCFVGPGWNHNNTNPLPVKPTLIVNGEDDFELAFLRPVSAVGLELLTNHRAVHKVTLTFTDATQEVIEDAALDTNTHTFEFVGFQSSKPIRSLFVDTTGGASENEGIAAIWTAP
ncbi:hypothetical protein [Myxococcus sp. AS-1-15]|uniref:hypothetical protein n=1 Tax=Myxococcus sp. AS-1-15 TaxID=2874600 RepID=UPI001CBE77AF|nr:hypothetical protein [Myxococcus sp. AS-1-15]MBZ4395047.1 hypothetical protein [Myxococcus sp. AS-1-15]BDT36406.1 hypothetical protein MFMH1_60750 [Myxococcus sp. MH1]